MRGYFAIGIEGVSKPGNIGNLLRTAHGFGAAFVFTLRPQLTAEQKTGIRPGDVDTSKTGASVPYFEYRSVAEMSLPKGCQPIGVEITDEATELPSFRHPLQAAYILGSERLSLSEPVLEACDHVIKIPTKFSLNVATAGAIVMYDRLITLGKFAGRPVTPSGGGEPVPEHVHGGVVIRQSKN